MAMTIYFLSKFAFQYSYAGLSIHLHIAITRRWISFIQRPTKFLLLTSYILHIFSVVNFILAVRVLNH